MKITDELFTLTFEDIKRCAICDDADEHLDKHMVETFWVYAEGFAKDSIYKSLSNEEKAFGTLCAGLLAMCYRTQRYGGSDSCNLFNESSPLLYKDGGFVSISSLAPLERDIAVRMMLISICKIMQDALVWEESKNEKGSYTAVGISLSEIPYDTKRFLRPESLSFISHAVFGQEIDFKTYDPKAGTYKFKEPSSISVKETMESLSRKIESGIKEYKAYMSAEKSNKTEKQTKTKTDPNGDGK